MVTKCVLCFSGGLDSTVCLYHARSLGMDVYPISVDYGQRHKRELYYADRVLRNLDPTLMMITSRWKVLPMEFLGRSIMRGSSQTGHVEVPDGHYEEESMKATVVPNRNMVLLSLATAYAISVKAEVVMYAAHAGDHAIYPDCRPQFVLAMFEAMSCCDWNPPELQTPFINMSKQGIVNRGVELNVPFELTYSCYKGREKHCGRCGTCTERREAFQLAGVTDPTTYEA